MCGITGIVYKSSFDNYSDIKNMNDAIAHRGPDGEGFIAINSYEKSVIPLGGKKTPVSLPSITDYNGKADIYLAHRRLSILDLSKAGHQPMTNSDETLWITYNGEIYNYKSLREELKKLGYSFKSDTDTEVLLYAYEEWGEKCLEKLNGMFAFVIYDKRQNILFGARDRFGVKPLYFTTNDTFFAFNSEIKGLLASGKINRKVNIDAAASYLKYGLETYFGETMFQDISELLPSQYFIYNIVDKDIKIQTYYDLSFNDKWESYNEEKCNNVIQKVRELVLDSVRLRLNADVTVGSCLSGGMDSSSIVCSINQLLKTEKFSSLGAKQGVVTACFNDKRIDESYWAKLVADKVNAKWIPVYPQKNELISDLQDMIYSQDVPFGSTSIYAQYRVMKAAKENGITVMLDGQGGDELFTGYTPYYKMFYSEAYRNNENELLKSEQRHIANTPFQNIKIKSFYKDSYIREIAKKILPSWIKQKIIYMLSKPDISSKYILANGKMYYTGSFSTLNSMLYNLMAKTSLPLLLKYEDRNSMRFSVESRTPFADDINLIQFIFNLPGSYKIHNGWSKYLLRESMNGIIPDEIRLRTDKIGFATPEYDWLKDIKQLIFDCNNSDISTIIDMNQLDKDWDFVYQNQNKVGITMLWKYINFILWFDVFKVAI